MSVWLFWELNPSIEVAPKSKPSRKVSTQSWAVGTVALGVCRHTLSSYGPCGSAG